MAEFTSSAQGLHYRGDVITPIRWTWVPQNKAEKGLSRPNKEINKQPLEFWVQLSHRVTLGSNKGLSFPPTSGCEEAAMEIPDAEDGAFSRGGPSAGELPQQVPSGLASLEWSHCSGENRISGGYPLH